MHDRRRAFDALRTKSGSVRRQRLAYRISPGDRAGHALRFLEREVWPRIPEDQLGRRLSRGEEDEILGYGPEGV